MQGREQMPLILNFLFMISSDHIVQRILRLCKIKLLQSVVVKGIFGYVLANNEKQTLKKTNNWLRNNVADPDPHKSEKVEALESRLGAVEGPNL